MKIHEKYHSVWLTVWDNPFLCRKLSELTDIEPISYEQAAEVSGCELVIYLGGLYAGGVKGLKHALKYFPKEAELILITVGLADPADSENVKNIRKSLKNRCRMMHIKEPGSFIFGEGLIINSLHSNIKR